MTRIDPQDVADMLVYVRATSTRQLTAMAAQDCLAGESHGDRGSYEWRRDIILEELARRETEAALAMDMMNAPAIKPAGHAWRYTAKYRR